MDITGHDRQIGPVTVNLTAQFAELSCWLRGDDLVLRRIAQNELVEAKEARKLAFYQLWLVHNWELYNRSEDGRTLDAMDSLDASVEKFADVLGSSSHLEDYLEPPKPVNEVKLKHWFRWPF